MGGLWGAVKNAFGMVGPESSVIDERKFQPKSDQDYVDYVNRLYDEWYEWRLPYESGWYLDVAFYLGMQWHEWNDTYKFLKQPKAPSWRVRYVVNQIMPMIETMVGKMTRGQPVLSCVPKQSPSGRAYTDARMGDKVLKGLWQPLHLPTVLQELFYWAFITGDGYLKACWDPTAGKAIKVPGFPTVYPGQVHVIPMGPYSILTPPYQSSLNLEPAKLMECRLYDIDHARMMFPDVARQIIPQDEWNRSETYEQRLVGLVSPMMKGEGRRRPDNARRCLVKELWEDPQTLTEEEREEFPDGRLTKVVNSILAEPPTNNPYGVIPYLHLKGKVVPGRYHGASLVDQLIPVQRNLNRGRSDVIESRGLCAKPMVNVEQGHGIVRPLAEPGRWLERRKGWMAPQFLDPPKMSDYHIKDLADTREDFQAVSQQREVSRGQLPSANVTGVAINMLQEADNVPLGPLANRIATLYEGLGERIITIARRYYKEPRMLQVVGEGHETEVVEYIADQHPTELTVRCAVDSVMPESRAAKQARVMEAVNGGVLDPTTHRAQILKVMQFGNVEEVWETADLHRQKAKREHRLLKMGYVVPVDSFDDAGTHLLTHTEVQVSAEYETWPPEVKRAFEIHQQMHRDQLAAQALAMAPAQPAPQVAVPRPQPTGQLIR